MENIAVAQNLSNTKHPAQTFLARLWGDSSERAFVSGKQQGGTWSDTPVSSTAEAMAETERRANSDTYMSCATFPQAGGRKAENAIAARAFWLDLDCGPEKAAKGAGYESKNLAKESLAAFCKALGIPEPTIVDSGNGLHIYWFLDESLPAATWKPVANMLKALTRKHGLKADDSCTADIARVLRVPGTYNHKDPANPKQVKIKRLSPPVSTAFFTAPIEKAHAEIAAVREIATAPKDIPAFMTGERGNLAALVTPETPEALHRLQDALSCISPDCDRDTWMRVVWSIQAHGWPSCIDIAQSWSAGSSDKYNDADFRVLVESFDPTGGTGAGTLYHIAKQHGWLDPMTQQQTQAACPTETIDTTEPGDMQAARVFARLNGGKLLYVTQAGRWMHWDGVRWCWCGVGEEMQAAKHTANAVLDRCIQLVRQDAERNRKRLAFAFRLQNLPRLTAMLQLAQSEPGMRVASMTELDSDPWLLGAQNCTIDLKSGACLDPDQLDEQVVKMLAGREQLSARFLHREFFDFWPTAKPWLRTNHRPIVHGTDDGIWRRLHLIPFKRKYSESERNPWLEQQLMEESAGILAWMVEGCLEWQRIGLAPSQLVRNESASYRTESDLLGEFLQDVCTCGANEREQQTAVFSRWRYWCESNALRCGAKASFTRKLSERGFKESRSNGNRYYSGLKLREFGGV